MNPFVHRQSSSVPMIIVAFSAVALVGWLDSPRDKDSFEVAVPVSKRYVPPAPIVVISKRKAVSRYKSKPVRRVATRKGFTYKRTDSLTAGSLASVIHLGESRKRGYQDYNRGSSRRCNKSRKNLHFTKWTMKQIRGAQSLAKCNRKRLFAVGAWQIIPSTMSKAVSSMGIKDNSRLTPALQNSIFVNFLTKRKRPSIYKYVVGRGDLKKAGLGVSLEWASMQSPVNRKFYKKKCRKGVCRKVVSVNCRKGRGCYDGWGSNVAHTSYKHVRKALVHARKTYSKLIKEGHSANKAYALALGINNT